MGFPRKLHLLAYIYFSVRIKSYVSSFVRYKAMVASGVPNSSRTCKDLSQQEYSHLHMIELGLWAAYSPSPKVNVLHLCTTKSIGFTSQSCLCSCKILEFEGLPDEGKYWKEVCLNAMLEAYDSATYVHPETLLNQTPWTFLEQCDESYGF
jgi:hypothetical protein